MKLGGIMKTTLLDYPGKIACTVFTKGCNLRCPFCHNSSLVIPERFSNEEYSEEEFFSFLKKRSGILDGVVVSGGEPTIQPDIFDFLFKIKQMGYSVKLDTNGTAPEKIKEILQGGLVDYIAMDIKNSREKYAVTSGGNILHKVEESIFAIMSSEIEYEFRTTSVAELHEISDFFSIGKWIKGAKKYFIQAYNDSGDILSTLPFSAPSDSMLTAFLAAVRENVPTAELRGV